MTKYMNKGIYGKVYKQSFVTFHVNLVEVGVVE